ncbi:hypothetical protein Tco_0964984 [Tanacetum coccineum]
MMSQTRNTRSRENSAQPHLVFTNDDLLTEILIRLPILCIYLFTTVSKLWLQILTSTHFTDRRRKIPIHDPPIGIFANHLTSLFEFDFVSLDLRLNSKKSTMDHSFGSAEEVDHDLATICLGEGEEDAFVVINLSEKVIKYNLISKTNIEIFDIGSNQMDDDDDAVVFIPPFKVDPNLYEFILSLAKI